jgi:hypothetical protein
MTSRQSMVSRRVRRKSMHWIIRIVLLLYPVAASAQGQWTSETVDSAGEFLAMTADKSGNIHISYYSSGTLKYGFRPSHSSRWFTMVIPGAPSNGYTSTPTGLAVDAQGNPHICFTPGVFEYASFDGKKWNLQQIDPGSGLIEYNCSIAIAPDDTQHATWYQYSVPGVPMYAHLKHAVLQNGVWIARTLDFESQTGKWSCITVDAQGTAHMSYDSFVLGKLKYGVFNGKEWKMNVVDSREMGDQTEYSRGMGNNLVLNRDGRAQISYEYADALLYAWQTATSWKIDTITRITTSGSWMGYRTRQALDPEGNPHVVYEDAGSVKHAFWDGTSWRIQLISGPGLQTHRFCTIAIDQEGTIYIGYRDASDGSVKIAVGRQQAQAQTSPPPKKTER